MLRLCCFHLSNRRKNEKKGCLEYSNHCFFPTYSSASFRSQFLSGKPTQAPTSGFSYQTKIYRTCATNMALSSLPPLSLSAHRGHFVRELLQPLQHGRRVGEEEKIEIRVLSGETFHTSCRDISVVVSENNGVVKPK